MNTSFYNGISGVKTNQFAIDTWSDNIANQNTYGFKENLPEFETQFSQALSSTENNPVASDIGLGSAIQGTSLDLSQGELINTDRNFDTVINGNGWYAFEGKNKTYYTKLGAFYKDKNGDLVNANGEYLLGTSNPSIKPVILPKEKLQNFGSVYTKNGSKDPTVFTVNLDKNTPLGNINNQTKLHLPTFLYTPPVPTKNVSFGANLNNEVKSTIDPTTGKEIAKSSDHFMTSLINQDGNKNILDMTFTKQFPTSSEGSLWNADFKILKNDGTKTPGVTYDPTKYLTYPNENTLYQIVDNKQGTLKFNGTGALIEANIPSLNNEGVPIKLNLGTPLNPKIPNSGYDGMTTIKGLGHESKFAKNDGTEEGFLKNYQIQSNGNITAVFNNGESASVGKIAIYHFQNEGGLQKIDNDMFVASDNSGKPFFYTKDGHNIDGDNILTNKLEDSNVRLSVALSELIVVQKAFDASAKSITTSNQMIKKAINMKT